MLISRNSKILAASLLALALAACTTKRTDGTDQGAGAATATDGAGAGGAIGADASAASVGGGLDSQSLGGDGTGAAGGAGAAGSAPLSVRVIHFDYDSAELSQDSYPVLQAHAQHLSNNPSARVAISGHTDERGTREYNMALGERRAKTVAAFLTSNGAKPDQLEPISFGEEKPLSMDDSESAWAENRRAELSYSAGQPKP